MNLMTPSDATSRVGLPGWRAAAPVGVLIFLAPVLAELLMGGLLLVSRLWLLVPEMAVYGGAALIILVLPITTLLYGSAFLPNGIGEDPAPSRTRWSASILKPRPSSAGAFG